MGLFDFGKKNNLTPIQKLIETIKSEGYKIVPTKDNSVVFEIKSSVLPNNADEKILALILFDKTGDNDFKVVHFLERANEAFKEIQNNDDSLKQFYDAILKLNSQSKFCFIGFEGDDNELAILYKSNIDIITHNHFKLVIEDLSKCFLAINQICLSLLKGDLLNSINNISKSSNVDRKINKTEMNDVLNIGLKLSETTLQAVSAYKTSIQKAIEVVNDKESDLNMYRDYFEMKLSDYFRVENMMNNSLNTFNKIYNQIK
jgi:hypothetical protein